MLVFGTSLTAAALAYTVIACVAALRRHNIDPPRGPRLLRPVTVLKPLCGAEPELAHCLRSFCEQDYPGLQIVFGVHDPADPALAVVADLERAFPHVEMAVVADPRRHGHSAKVSNLINMMGSARNDWLVLADSDVSVAPGYLAEVCAPLADPGVGIVTCAYRGRPVHRERGTRVWSLLGALFVNDWFMPSVWVAALFGSRDFAFGATIALRRETLESIGGLRAIANQLADDYRLGELTRRRGLRTVLSQVLVETTIDERTLRQLVRHETRWLRTIRAVRPGGYAAAAVTFGLPLALLGCALAAAAPVALGLLIATAAARVMLHFAAGTRQGAPAGAWRHLWALPASDLLGFALWCWGFAAREVQWREERYRVARDGSARPIT